MTVDQFFSEVQGYYGPYNPSQRKYVRQWLAGRSGNTIALLFAETLKAVSPIYKTPPGVKELEDADKAVWKRQSPELQAPPRLQIEYQPTEEERAEAAKILRGILGKLIEKQQEYDKERGEDVKNI